MNWLRSTTFCAIVPSQTEAAMKSTRAASAPMPGDGSAEDWARRSDSGMVGLRRGTEKLFFCLLLAQVVVADHEVGKDEAQDCANGPGQNNAPENPIGETEDVGERGRIAVVAEPVADADRVNAGREPNDEDQ